MRLSHAVFGCFACAVSLTLASAQRASQTVAVQESPQAGAVQPGMVLQSPRTSGCPVGVEAQRSAQGGVVQVKPQPAGKTRPSYRITLKPGPGNSQIQQIRLTLYGAAGPHVAPAGQDPGNESESLTASPEATNASGYRTTIHTRGLTSVQWIDLNEITYKNGDIWHAAAEDTCRIAPNSYLLLTHAAAPRP